VSAKVYLFGGEFSPLNGQNILKYPLTFKMIYGNIREAARETAKMTSLIKTGLLITLLGMAFSVPTYAQQKETHENQTETHHPRGMDNRGGTKLSTRTTRTVDARTFKENFGTNHTFRPNFQIREGVSRFQYSGFTFGLVEPWPLNWDTNDVIYVEYIDGMYFAMNPEYPNERVGVTIIE
jgi:hypothetical protein